MPNLIDNPSFEYNSAPTSVGTPTSSAQSTEKVYSSGYSWKVVTDAASEGIQLTVVTTSGKFYRVEVWVFVLSGTVDLKNFTFQNGITTYARSSKVGTWQKLTAVFRATAASTVLQIISSAAITFYVDDCSCSVSDDVTLTATPASAANSVESGGIRVDGLDTIAALSYPGRLLPNKGSFTFGYIPRHGSGTYDLYGQPYPRLATLYYGSDFIKMYILSSTQIRAELSFNSVTASIDFTYAFTAGLKYTIKVKYSGGGVWVYINGSLVGSASISAIFTASPSINIGSWVGASQADAVFSSP